MNLNDVIDEMESAESLASDARDMAESAVDQLKEMMGEINQLKNDWREYLDEHVHDGDISEYVINNCCPEALSSIGGQSEIYKKKKLESEQVQGVYREEVEVNRLARALMFAAFSQERAGRQTDWVEPLLDRAAKAEVNANFAESLKSDLRAGLVRADEADAEFAKRQKIDELWLRMKQVQSEIAEMRGDA